MTASHMAWNIMAPAAVDVLGGLCLAEFVVRYVAVTRMAILRKTRSRVTRVSEHGGAVVRRKSGRASGQGRKSSRSLVRAASRTTGQFA